MKLLSHLRLIGLSALVSVAASGCVFTLGDGTNQSNGKTNNGSTSFVPNTPKVPGADCGFNGVVSQTLECLCKPGFSWCDPTLDPGPRGRHHCCVGSAPSGSQGCESGSNNMLQNGQCVCINGFDWCDKSNTKNLHCCAIKNDAVVPGKIPAPQESCDPAKVTSWCSHTDSQGPVGSQSFNCVDGKWVDTTNKLDEQCRLDGYDFSFGCTHSPATTGKSAYSKILCGYGPGDPCESSTADACSADNTKLLYCLHKKLTADQCTPKTGETCKTKDNKEFEFGKCGMQAGRPSCLCYDEQSSGSTTGGTTSSGTGTGAY